jgi:hypothetical protein
LFWQQVTKYFDVSGVGRDYLSVTERGNEHTVFRFASKPYEDYKDVPDERIDRTVILMDAAIDEKAKEAKKPEETG